jgi:hypothetical protein
LPRGPKGEKRPGDVIGAAVMVARIATGEIEDTITKKNPNAAALGKLGGAKGGKARADSLPPFSIQLIDLPPGQNHTEYFLLNKIYDVSSPGVYLVQVQQQPVAGRPTAQSNTIKIVVQ